MYKFYIEMDGEQFGPYSAKEVKELSLLPDIMVRQEGSGCWQRADSYNFVALSNDEFIESLNLANQPARDTMTDGEIQQGTNTQTLNISSITSNEDFSANDISSVPCPECGRMSDSLKCFILPHHILFLGIYAQWQTVQHICCPSCMRKHIGIKCFTYNIILANIMWPFIILPWGIIQLIRTTQKGHTKTVKNMLNNQL